VDLYEFLKQLTETPTELAIEPLWTLQKNGRTISCVLCYRGKAYGVGAQILSDGDLRVGRRFETKELAVQCAHDRGVQF
jgi:hypothetical protein